MNSNRPLRISLLHPAIGWGGAERLVLDLIGSWVRSGHNVTLITSQIDKNVPFPESSSSKVTIILSGRYLPQTLFGRLRAPLAILRMSWLAFICRRYPADFVVTDLVPHFLPLIKYFAKVPVVFYCHYPDKLLTPERTAIYQLYRRWIDYLDQKGMMSADSIWVNSHYTLGICKNTYSKINHKKYSVLYPATNGSRFQAKDSVEIIDDENITYVSVNRFAPDKNLILVLEAFEIALQKIDHMVATKMKLVLAGGYDKSMTSNVKTLEGLKQWSDDHGLTRQITFIPNISEQDKISLYQSCRAMIYSPTQEHFGIGPIEAMAAGRPVIAVNHGGPAETIENNVTGILCKPEANIFAGAMIKLALDKRLSDDMGAKGQKRVNNYFEFDTLDSSLKELTTKLMSPLQ